MGNFLSLCSQAAPAEKRRLVIMILNRLNDANTCFVLGQGRAGNKPRITAFADAWDKRKKRMGREASQMQSNSLRLR